LLRERPIHRPSIGLQAFGESVELESRPRDHLLEIEDELPVDQVVGGIEGIERRLSSRMEDLEHVDLQPNLFIHTLGIPVGRHAKTLR